MIRPKSRHYTKHVPAHLYIWHLPLPETYVDSNIHWQWRHKSRSRRYDCAIHIPGRNLLLAHAIRYLPLCIVFLSPYYPISGRSHGNRQCLSSTPRHRPHRNTGNRHGQHAPQSPPAAKSAYDLGCRHSGDAHPYPARFLQRNILPYPDISGLRSLYTVWQVPFR